jgi:LysM repeat protein
MFVKVAALLLAVAFVVGVLAHPSGGAGRPVRYVVRPTDTLWSIAARHYAGDPREGVWKLQRRNHLTSTTLVPGQRLVLP